MAADATRRDRQRQVTIDCGTADRSRTLQSMLNLLLTAIAGSRQWRHEDFGQKVWSQERQAAHRCDMEFRDGGRAGPPDTWILPH
jgi:hypothetical protein